MGATCGCLGKESENEISAFPGDIFLAKSFSSIFNEYPNGQITVPSVDLEKEFTSAINNLQITNPIVHVLLLIHYRKSEVILVLSIFL